ncbi:FkbM family methyltransferase [Bifidobacterium sp. DSM 109958]|uniref:FkbM family methyltransferase n=1 Tax=Bifidobacterium moraviense TaxID=2675323 RepID=A0A7Y0F264_9BIFI|nr:class I SAM-dependent methyltransferase [Bifidobacterium sp. DSM 109958]NMN00675.1 FkbM family methyltransferase [Bifidobacterium sp. DSM 109958]
MTDTANKTDRTDRTEFHGKAEAYAQARPGYPAEAMAYIGTLIGGSSVPDAASATEGLPVPAAAPDASPVTVADIGAGTGKFTVPLAALGHPVFAVEPDADMRAALRGAVADLPNVTVVDGNAERTGLPDGSVDVVTCAQSLHWFRHDAFLAECARIARCDRGRCGDRGGRGDRRILLVSIYNRTSFDSGMRHWDGGPALAGSVDHVRRTTTEYFRHPAVREFANPIRYTLDSWRAFMDSHSHSPLPDSPDYPAHRAWVDRIFAQRAVDDNVCVVTGEVLTF